MFTFLTDIHLLITKLNGLPLALTQAGAFIGRTGVDVQIYIDYFDRTWSNLMEKQDQFPLQEYGERSMLTTWKLSYDQVLRQNEAAAWLLRLWAFFYHDDFSYGLLEKSTTWMATREIEAPAWLVKLAGSSLEFSNAMGLLKAYSMIDSQVAGSYSMHSVPHQWSRSLSLDADALSLLSISVCVLASTVLGDHEKEHWKSDRRVIQHVLHASNESRILRILAQQQHVAEAAHWLAMLLDRQGKLGQAEQMYKRALAGKEKALGPNHTSTLNTVNNLGNLYSDQGKLDEAEQMYQRALLVYQRIYGPSHERVTATSEKLASTRLKKGKLSHMSLCHFDIPANIICKLLKT